MSHSPATRQISEKQLAANRANAQRSTGPRTAAGKCACARNAVTHAITAVSPVRSGEDHEAYARFTAGLIQDLNPASPVEHQIAATIADGFWRIARIRSVENDLFQFTPDPSSPFGRAEAFLAHSKAFDRLSLYEQRIHRNIERLMRELRTLRHDRARAEVAAVKAAARRPQPAEIKPLPASNGSVFSNAHAAHFTPPPTHAETQKTAA